MNEWIGKEVKTFSKIEHETVSFVDDDNCIMEFKIHEYVNKYLDSFFKLLKSYFNCMQLKMNDKKTNLMILARPNKNEKIKYI